MGFLLELFFGCQHKKLSFPLTPSKTTRRRVVKNQHTINPTTMYVVCLDCGREFVYNWDQMRVMNGIRMLIPSRPVTAERR